MAKQVTDYSGSRLISSCLGCARENGEISNKDTVFQTTYFDAHQDFEIPIPGFIIVSSRRHIQSIDEFTEAEKIDFIDTICKIRKALRETLIIDVVYLHQEEDTSHHFHLWIFPRYEWMEKFGRKIQSVRQIMEHARQNMKTEENLTQVSRSLEKLKSFFLQK